MIILHGDNQTASRNRLLELKSASVSSGKYVIDFEAPALNLGLLKNSLSSKSLLGETVTVVIQNLFSSRPGRNKKEIIDYLLSHPKLDILVWESKDVTSQIKGIPQTQIIKYNLPRNLFTFIDNINLDNFNLALVSSSPESIFALLTDRLHKLLMIKKLKPTQYEALGLPPWQIKNLEFQVSKYSFEKLRQMNTQLLEIDHLNKTSGLPYNLSSALELWLSRL